MELLPLRINISPEMRSTRQKEDLQCPLEADFSFGFLSHWCCTRQGHIPASGYLYPYGEVAFWSRFQFPTSDCPLQALHFFILRANVFQRRAVVALFTFCLPATQPVCVCLCVSLSVLPSPAACLCVLPLDGFRVNESWCCECVLCHAASFTVSLCVSSAAYAKCRGGGTELKHDDATSRCPQREASQRLFLVCGL